MPRTGLILDALYPPSPMELVRDLEQVGAVGFAFYVLRRDASGGLVTNGTVTPAHINAIRQSGRLAFPICVPGSNPQSGDAGTAINNASLMDTGTSLMVFDIETFSFPPHAWLAEAVMTCRMLGWSAARYGDVAPLSQYPLADGDWYSHGKIPVHTNQLHPVPELPLGSIGDQYTVGAIVNGHEYDGSVFDLDYLDSVTVGPGGAIDMFNVMEDDAMVMITPVGPDGQPTGPGFLVIGGRAVEIPAAVNDTVDDTRESAMHDVPWLHYSERFVAAIVDALNAPPTVALPSQLAPHHHPSGSTGPAVADPPAPTVRD